MIVFGAGASFGSRPGAQPVIHVPGAPERRVRRPPLTSGLFSDDLAHYAVEYPGSVAAISLLRSAQRRDKSTAIESSIARLYEDAVGNPELARQLMALRFYLNDVIRTETDQWWTALHGFTHYANLLARLGEWRSRSNQTIALVTFNYDELLDRSARSQAANWTLDDFQSYIDRPDWRLYKLHGSIGWSRLIALGGSRADVTPAQIIARAHRFGKPDGELRPVRWEQAVDASDLRDGLVAVPGIAVPTDRKDTFECPSEHIERFAADIAKVDRLLLVGWRAAEPHATQLLERIQAGYHLAICDMGAADINAVRDRLGAAATKCHQREPTRITGGFEALLADNVLENWLHQPLMLM